VIETRPTELTRENFVEHPPKDELYEKKLGAVVVGGRSRKIGWRLHVTWRRLV